MAAITSQCTIKKVFHEVCFSRSGAGSIYAMPFQYILHRVRCNDVTGIGERSLDSVVAPGDILPRHVEYQIGDLSHDVRSIRSLPGTSPLLRNELTVPSKKGIRCHKRFKFVKQPAAKVFGFHGQPYPLFVGNPKPLCFELLLENTVLFDEIVDHRLLVAVKPTG